MFTSRSAIETYHDCPRMRFNQYIMNGTGIVSKQSSVPLATGSAVHKGVEVMLNRLRIDMGAPDVDYAVGEAVEQYKKDVADVGFREKDLQNDRQQWFTYNEQKALVEGMIRAWAIVELPKIQARYKVIAVEREIEPIEIASGVMMQAKVDAEFQEIETGDYHNYSIKTMKRWDERAENSYKSDLQGITETWMTEEDSARELGRWELAITTIEHLMSSYKIPSKNLVMMREFLVKKRPSVKKIMGIRFCFLIKGNWMIPPSQRNDPAAVKVTYSPLIRGYKNVDVASVNYAHSWNYPNPNNKSGESILGRGWEPFNVWESGMSIKEWIGMLASGEIQPDCGDIIDKQVISPAEFFRDETDIAEGIEEIRAQETKIARVVEDLDEFAKDEYHKSLIADMFPHRRKHCEFHFGGQCEYKSLCWSPEVAANPMGSGLYQIRVPHHEAEMEGVRSITSNTSV